MQLNRARAVAVPAAAWPAAPEPVSPAPRLRAEPLAYIEPPVDPAVRFDALLLKYDRLIRAIVARLGRQFGVRRGAFLVEDDIAQEVRLDLWKQVARGQVIDFPATYIYKATIRETVRALRRLSSREMESIDADGPAARTADGADPFQLLAARDQWQAVVHQIDALAPERREAVRAHLCGYEFQEVMLMHGWSYQKARNLVARGMADLRCGLLGEERPRRRRASGDPRLRALQARLTELRAGMHALRERRRETVRLETTPSRVRK